jgi:hypothetical protein
MQPAAAWRATPLLLHQQGNLSSIHSTGTNCSSPGCTTGSVQATTNTEATAQLCVHVCRKPGSESHDLYAKEQHEIRQSMMYTYTLSAARLLPSQQIPVKQQRCRRLMIVSQDTQRLPSVSQPATSIPISCSSGSCTAASTSGIRLLYSSRSAAPTPAACSGGRRSW